MHAQGIRNGWGGPAVDRRRFPRNLWEDRDEFLRSVFAPRDHTEPDYRGVDPDTAWADALAVVGDPRAEPSEDVTRAGAAGRKRTGRIGTIEEVYEACARMEERARTPEYQAMLEREREIEAAPKATPPPKTEEPTVTLEDRIIEALTGAEPLSTKAVVRLVGGRNQAVRAALNAMRLDGRIERTKAGRAHLWNIPPGDALERFPSTVPPTDYVLGEQIDEVNGNSSPESPALAPKVVVIEGTTLDEKARDLIEKVDDEVLAVEDLEDLIGFGDPVAVRALTIVAEAEGMDLTDTFAAWEAEGWEVRAA